MRERDIVQETFDSLSREAGFVKKSGSWYRRQAETIAVLNLQRSQYGPRYYVNVALWLLPLGDSDSPKEHMCHVRTRLDELVGVEWEERVAALFDVEVEIEDETRRAEMIGLFRGELLPVLDACGTIDGLRGSDEGRPMRERSVVDRAAIELLG